MQGMQLKDLVMKLRQFHCEFQTVEVKAAKGGCPKHLYDTLSSFSNQSSGGVILFGIDEKADFEVVGVYDARQILRLSASMMRRTCSIECLNNARKCRQRFVLCSLLQK